MESATDPSIYTSKTRRRDTRRFEEYDGLRDVGKLGAGDSFYMARFIKSRKEADDMFKRLLTEVDFVPMFYFTNTAATGASKTQTTSESPDSSDADDDDDGYGTRDETSSPASTTTVDAPSPPSTMRARPIPRMVSAQTGKSSAVSPIYRMPGCNQKNIQTREWTPTVADICARATAALDGNEFNHCVCTLYRDENDSLGHHQDKLLDLTPGSVILSVSFGAPRPLVFTAGKTRQIVTLQPGSLLAIGPKTNVRFKHGVPKALQSVGPRISLSVRSISTFVTKVPEDASRDSETPPETSTFRISGQGEQYQTKNYPFVANFDNPDDYPAQVAEDIREHTKRAQERLQELRDAAAGHEGSWETFSASQAAADAMLESL